MQTELYVGDSFVCLTTVQNFLDHQVAFPLHLFPPLPVFHDIEVLLAVNPRMLADCVGGKRIPTPDDEVGIFTLFQRAPPICQYRAEWLDLWSPSSAHLPGKVRHTLRPWPLHCSFVSPSHCCLSYRMLPHRSFA